MSTIASQYPQRPTNILTQSDAQEQLLTDWVLWQCGRGMSDKTITDRLTIIRRIPDAAIITPQGVDRFLTSAAWAKATRANYHGAIRAWCKWLIITGRRADDPTTIATTPKVKKGRPRPVADAHLGLVRAGEPPAGSQLSGWCVRFHLGRSCLRPAGPVRRVVAAGFVGRRVLAAG